MLRRRCADHQLDAFLSRGKLGDVFLRVGSADMLLHRTIALLLNFMDCHHRIARWVERDRMGRRELTPRQRFRHLEPSCTVSGQTTSLAASDVENELGREVLGGMARRIQPTEVPQQGFELPKGSKR